MEIPHEGDLSDRLGGDICPYLWQGKPRISLPQISRLPLSVEGHSVYTGVMKISATITGLLLCLLIFSPALAQRQENEGWNPRERIQGWDRNGDGYLEEEEIPMQARRFVRRLARRVELDQSQPFPVESLLQALGEATGGESSENSTQRVPAEPPLVPGFGEVVQITPPPAFGSEVDAANQATNTAAILHEQYSERVIEYVDDIFRRYDSNGDQQIDASEQEMISWGNPPPAESDTNNDGILDRSEFCERIAKRFGQGRDESREHSQSRESESQQYTQYARRMIERYDENENGVLDRDEWEAVRLIRTNPEETDRNRDGRVTLEELTARVRNYGDDNDSSRDRSSRSSSSRDSSSARSRDEASDSDTTARFVTPSYRLPRGIPSWFSEKDANGDGQISMNEFASQWSEEQVEEFAGYDLNQDGLLTPQECVAAD